MRKPFQECRCSSAKIMKSQVHLNGSLQPVDGFEMTARNDHTIIPRSVCSFLGAQMDCGQFFCPMEIVEYGTNTDSSVETEEKVESPNKESKYLDELQEYCCFTIPEDDDSISMPYCCTWEDYSDNLYSRTGLNPTRYKHFERKIDWLINWHEFCGTVKRKFGVKPIFMSRNYCKYPWLESNPVNLLICLLNHEPKSWNGAARY